ncbi:two component winged helix family transcriptional regulator [Pseudomonas putida S11]|nr:two component winged helix family transcriptional regulator [Pseudomonas putida S11]
MLRRARGLANQPTLEAAGLHLDERPAVREP